MLDKKETVHFKIVGWVVEYAEFEELLITFLCQEGIYFQFFYNLKHYPLNEKITIFEIFESIKNISKVSLGRFFACTFEWNATKEKGIFWSKIHHKFDNYYNHSIVKL